jgi:hypothetical protein
MRDFVIAYERRMRAEFVHINSAIEKYNTCIWWKDFLLLGYVLPYDKRIPII